MFGYQEIDIRSPGEVIDNDWERFWLRWFSRKIRDKFVEEANMNFDNLIKLLDDKISRSEVYRKLKERLENVEQLNTV